MTRVPLALALLCSCAIPGPDEDVSQVEQFIIPHCDDWGCGMNSPYIDSRGFHFLYEDGTANPQGFAIQSFEKNGWGYGFTVTNGRIVGTHPWFPDLVDQALVNAKLHITFRGQPMYTVKITGVSRIPSWANQNGGHFMVDTYRLEWSADGNKFTNWCSHPGDDETLGMNEFHTLLFEGDNINSAAKTVSSAINNNVINFGCAGGTLAKMHLTGHTEVAKRLGFSTTIPERQTMLKMLSGDYCGEGVAFTVGGQPLQWADNKGWLSVPPPAEREALWTSSGATCLNTPRVVANPSQVNPNEFPDIEASIAAVCQRPVHCASGASAYVPDPGYHLVSSNSL